MGKYMRKSKTTGEIALMDVSHQSSLGVRTRAKTLALRKAAVAPAASTGGSYIQLRSRRLEKPPAEARRQKHVPKERSTVPNPNSASLECLETEKLVVVDKEEEIVQENKNESADCGIEASYGENMLEFEGRERSTRETTPCSLIRDPETIRSPGSSTRPTSSTNTNCRVQRSMQRHIPTSNEMDEFFTGVEEQQQRQFIEKYNFDPVNDKPLPGRYEWVKVDMKK